MAAQVRYSVMATVKTEHLEEYLEWLRGGHVQALVDEGGASSGEVVQLGSSEQDGISVSKVASHYVFPTQAVLDAYAGGEVAARLRGEGVGMFIDTKKVLSMERLVGPIIFQYSK